MTNFKGENLLSELKICHILVSKLLFDFFNKCCGQGCCGHSSNAFELYDDASFVLLRSAHVDAFNSSKVARNDAHALALSEVEVVGVEKSYLLLSAASDGYEVVHLVFRNSYGHATDSNIAFVVVLLHEVEVVMVVGGSAEFVEPIVATIDKNVVVDGYLLFIVESPSCIALACALHGDEAADLCFLLELSLDFQFRVVLHDDDKPVVLRAREWKFVF